MKQCPHCRQQFPDATNFCTNCGSPLQSPEAARATRLDRPVVQPTLQPGGGYVPPQPIKAKNNTLLIIVCAVASVIICGLLLFIFIGRNEDSKKAADWDDEDTEMVTSSDNAQAHKYDWLSERAVTASDLEGKTAGDLRLMRNAIFARHGYRFKSADLQEYFSQFDWYEPRYSDVNDRLSTIEKKNIEFIKKYEGGGNAASGGNVSSSRLASVGFTDDYSDIVCYVELSDSDISGLSKAQLRILRNTIYARHGRKFKSEDLRNYFNGFSWYDGRYDEISPSSLSAVEKHNIALIQKYE